MLTKEDVEAVLARVSFWRDFPYHKPELHYDPSWREGALLTLIVYMPLRLPDDDRYKMQIFSLPFKTPSDEAEVKVAVRQLMHDFFTHEADETLLLDGALMNDPHAKKAL